MKKQQIFLRFFEILIGFAGFGLKLNFFVRFIDKTLSNML